jgi:hypothetical protein
MDRLKQLKKSELQNAKKMRNTLISVTKGEKKTENIDANMGFLYFNMRATVYPPKGRETNATVLEHTMKLKINSILDQIGMCLSWITNPKDISKVATVVSKISINKLMQPMVYIEKNKERINKMSEEKYDELEQKMDIKYSKYINSINQKLHTLYRPYMKIQYH